MAKPAASGEADDCSPSLEPAEEPVAERRTPLSNLWRLIRTAGFTAVLLGGLAVAAGGCGLAAFVYLTRSYSPPAAHLSRDLYFDYADSTAVAAASFLDAALPGAQGPPRAFPPGQLLDVWLQLEAAEPHGDVNTDMFQVLAQLRTGGGKAAATASRPCLVPFRGAPWRWIRAYAAAPLVLLGLRSEHELVRVPLFSRYREQAGAPFLEFRAVLKAVQREGSLPHLYSATVHVELALGLVGRLLYLARPGGWTALLLLAVAALLLLGGAASALVTAALWWACSSAPAGGQAGSPGRSEQDAESDAGLREDEFASPRKSAAGEGDFGSSREGTPVEELLEGRAAGSSGAAAAGLQKRRGRQAA